MVAYQQRLAVCHSTGVIQASTCSTCQSRFDLQSGSQPGWLARDRILAESLRQPRPTRARRSFRPERHKPGGVRDLRMERQGRERV